MLIFNNRGGATQSSEGLLKELAAAWLHAKKEY